MIPTHAMEREHVETVLQDMEVKPWPGVYVLGCLDRRVTVYSQQVRALNLAAALFAGKKVKPGDEVVVVGAGAAGLTCAAGLWRLGAKVTVLEKDHEILSTFRGASQRWLHPGVYDWPMEGWSLEDTGLPLLGWTHGLVSKVRGDLAEAWEAIEIAARGKIKVEPNAEVVSLGPPTDRPRTVVWNPGGQRKRTRTVVLAVGFGLETYGSYWDTDDIEPKSDGKLRRWLVSGCGDGALTDLLRLCIEGFRHHEMLPRFTQDPRMRGIKEEIQRIESMSSSPQAVHEAYAALDAPWVRAAMKPRADTKVWLNAPADFLTTGASALNRFLVAQLHRDRRFDLLPGRLLPPANEHERTTVARFEGQDDPEHFDCIVRRHGPTPALRTVERGAIDKALADERQRRIDKPTLTDQTRQRRWPHGLFGPETRAYELARYRAELEQRHGFIQLAGFETRVRVPVRLDDLYVPLHAVVRAAGGEKDWKAEKNEKAEPSDGGRREIELAHAFEEAAKASQRGVLVLGAPGSGKTTHVQQVLLQVARKGSDSIGLPPGMLPVLLPLRRLDERHTSLKAFVEDQLDTGGFDTGEGFGARMWKDGKLLLLLDGLDEVADADERLEVVGWIRQECEARAEDRFVVTCRYAGYPEDDRLGERFLELELPAMNDAQVQAFVDQWYEAVERAAHGDPSLAKTRAAALLAALDEQSSSTSFYSMATKPLLLSLMCLMHRDRGELPRKRVQLYEEAVAVLLEQWRRFKELPVTLSAREARLVLQPVAEQMHRHQESQSALDHDRRYTPIAKVDPGNDELSRRQVAARLLLERKRPELDRSSARAARPTQPTTTPSGPETKAGLEWVLVPAGSFMMGSPDDDALGFDDERPQHLVVLGKPFWLAKTPVTNAQYGAYLKANPDVPKPRFWGDDRYNHPQQPVVGVSWEDASEYCKRLGLVLPTEAQWEYACRAGTTTQYWSGDGEEDLARVGWYGGNSGGQLHAVREKPANDFGLYDMHGNVREWCRDQWVKDYEEAVHEPDDGLRTQPVGDASRVFRGGDFRVGARYERSAYRNARLARSAYRDSWRPDDRNIGVGFRPAQGHP